MDPAVRERKSASRKGIRIWPLLLILLLETGVLVFIWFIQDARVRQMQVMATMASAIVAGSFICLWFLAFSKIRVKRRFQGLGLLGLLCVLFLAAFEFEGMSGDLVPQFRLRLSQGNTVTGTKTLAGFRISNYPQFQGPNRTAILEGAEWDFDFDWETNPPELLWKRPVGEGISGFAISGSLAITQEQDEEGEKIVAYGLTSGEVIWEHRTPGHYQSPIAGAGPRSIPTIDSGRVFTMGSTGWLTVLQLDNGKLLWSKNILEENERPVPPWGKSCSPLVVNDQVIVSIYTVAVLAYSAEDGSELWREGSDGANYSSPTRMNLKGRDQIVSFNSEGPAGYAADGGKRLWSVLWPRGSEHVSLPLQVGEDRLLVSTGYGVGAKLIQFDLADDKMRPREVWQSNFLKSKFANFFVIGDYIYGLDDGIMVCLELATGKRVWKRGRYGHGQMILVNGTILLLAEDGQMFAIHPSPEGLEQLGAFPALDGHTWNPPALAGEILVVRNSREAAAYRLKFSQDRSTS